MKTTISILLGVVIVWGGLFVARSFRQTPTVHAQGGCDATSFSGGYGYHFAGDTYDSNFNVYYLGAAGRMLADGAGGITGGDTLSFDNFQVVRRTFTGTYTMNSDCTGSVTLQVTTPGVANPATVHADIVAVDNAREINFVQTDNFLLSGILKKQIQ